MLDEMLKDAQYAGPEQQRAALDWLAQAPQIEPDYKVYWNGFHELTSCRSIGMAVGPIPFTAMAEYTGYYEFTETEAHFFIKVVRLLDNAYLKLVHKKGEETNK